MSIARHPVAFLIGIGVVTLVGWVGVAPAKSRASSPIDLQGECGSRVKELQAEVRQLREQVRAMAEGKCDASSSLGRSTVSSRASLDTRVSVSGHALDAGTQTPTCDPPFGFDQRGIKYYYPECLDTKVSEGCSVPYGYTNAGIKFYKPNCLTQTVARASCDPPFAFDANGVKSYKPECL